MDPPHAAWTTIAFSKAASVRMSLDLMPRLFGHDEGACGSDGDVEPCGCAAG